MEYSEYVREDEAAPLLNEPEASPAFTKPSEGWQSELRRVVRYSIPLIATYLLQYFFSVITTFVAGHLGGDDLAAASIGLTTMTIGGFAIIEGMATALDTLCAQAYGSGKITMVGVYVQRMLLFMTLACVPMGSLWFFSGTVLSHLIPQRHLALKAGSFLRVSIIGLPGYASFEAGKRFLQAQEDFRTGMAVLLVCAPVNALLSWLFAFRLGMGLDGAALGAALANNLRPILLFLLTICFNKDSHKCWGGFSRAALVGWRPMVRLSLAGSAVTLAEWAAFEIVTFSTSYLSTVHLAAQTILTTTAVFMWHIPFSISVAVSTRIGHLVGAADLVSARRAARLYAVLFCVVGAVDAVVLFCLRDHIPALFSVDEAIRDLAASTMTAAAFFQLIDSIMCGCNGLLRGLGRQSVAAWVALVANYAVGVPLAVWLELGEWHFGLKGVWIGLGSGLFVSAFVEAIYIKMIDWQRCVDSVRSRGDL
jgi:MATE family multidrug resistance protein